MSSTAVWRRVAACMRACALSGLSLCFVSCYEREESSGRIDVLFDVVTQVSSRLCECRTDPSSECGFALDRFDCIKPIVKKHSADIADWTECTIDLYERLGTCLERGCNDGVEPCIEEVDLEEGCGEPPDPFDDMIEDEVSRTCLETIDCIDGTTAQGNICNAIAECRDGSDEQGCASDVEFNCQNGEQISDSWVCDGLSDCEDGSDEAQCTGSR
jgi:hypothetical protein